MFIVFLAYPVTFGHKFGLSTHAENKNKLVIVDCIQQLTRFTPNRHQRLAHIYKLIYHSFTDQQTKKTKLLIRPNLYFYQRWNKRIS